MTHVFTCKDCEDFCRGEDFSQNGVCDGKRIGRPVHEMTLSCEGFEMTKLGECYVAETKSG